MIKVLFTLEVNLLGEVSSCFTDSLSNLPNIGEKVQLVSENSKGEYCPFATVFDKLIYYRQDMTVESVYITIKYPFEKWLYNWKGFLFSLDKNKSMIERMPLSNKYLSSVFKELDKKDIVDSTYLQFDIDFMKRNKDLFDLEECHILLLEAFLNYKTNEFLKKQKL
ncbi:MAG: hypothetical protein IKN08_01060 [Bacteroidales bacterium]|nr:hypothetical protein [Bacteroidales bacterium]